MATRSNIPQQPFARGQGKPFVTGPYLGGFLYVLPESLTAGNIVTFSHTLRVLPRHVELVGTATGEYPSRVCFTALSNAQVTVQFESAQSAGATLWLW